jgi:hypothetical protein
MSDEFVHQRRRTHHCISQNRQKCLWPMHNMASTIPEPLIKVASRTTHNRQPRRLTPGVALIAPSHQCQQRGASNPEEKGRREGRRSTWHPRGIAVAWWGSARTAVMTPITGKSPMLHSGECAHHLDHTCITWEARETRVEARGNWR